MNKLFIAFFTFLLINLMLSVTVCNAQAPKWLWAKNGVVSDGSCKIIAITTDASGNSYITGYFFSKTVTFGKFTLINNSNAANMFIVKYDANGIVLWAKNPNGASVNSGSGGGSVALDNSGFIYITGSYSDGVKFDNKTLYSKGQSDIFWAKFDQKGNLVWVFSAGGMLNDYGSGIKVDSTGTIFLTGYFISTSVSFGSKNIINSGVNSTWDSFVAKINSNGKIIWVNDIGGDKDDIIYSITADNGGNSYLTGFFRSGLLTANNKSISNTNSGYDDIVVAKIDSNGITSWLKNIGGADDDYSQSLCLDNIGNVIIVGALKSITVSVDNKVITNPYLGISNVLIVKLDNNGKLIWMQSTGGKQDDYAASVSADKIGNIYVAGHFYSPSINFGNIKLSYNKPDSSKSKIFVTKYDKINNVVWAKTTLNSAYSYISSSTVDRSGNSFLVGGSLYDTLNFDTIQLITHYVNPSYQFGNFIAKLANSTILTSQTDLFCPRDSNGTATAQVFGNPLKYKFLWNTLPPQTTQTAIGLKAKTYTVTVTDSLGSQTTANVTIAEPNLLPTLIQQNICKGDSIVLNGNTYKKTGNYTDTLTSVTGCDSIVVLSLFVTPRDTIQQSTTICQGNSYNFYGTQLKNAGTYYHTLTSSYGCDSIIAMHIIVNPVYTTNNPQTICNGDVYVFKGHSYKTAGNYYDTLKTVSGCDSIIVTKLTVNPTFNTSNPQFICKDAPYVFNGHSYTTSGTYYDTLSSVLGCDSIIITQLVVYPTFYSNIKQTICYGSSYVFNGETLSISGIYFDSLTTIHGCDSIIQLTLFVAPRDTTVYSKSICQGEEYDFYGKSLTENGTYFHKMISSYGCDSVIQVNLKVHPLPTANAGEDAKIFVGNSVKLNANGGIAYQWTPSEYLDNPFISNPISTALITTNYTVKVTDNNKCSDIDSVTVTVEESTIWLPNVFNPNNPNPLNQKFYVRGNGVKEFELIIYNRWGEKVFETSDVNQGWDGTYKGKELPTSVFVYYLKATFDNGEKEEKEGNFTLLR